MICCCYYYCCCYTMHLIWSSAGYFLNQGSKQTPKKKYHRKLIFFIPYRLRILSIYVCYESLKISLFQFLCILRPNTYDALSRFFMSKCLKKNFLVSRIIFLLLLESNMSSTYKTRNINLLPLNLWYIHSSTKLDLNLNEIITWWNLKYHYRDTYLSS
jgi:hypothetical protein